MDLGFAIQLVSYDARTARDAEAYRAVLAAGVDELGQALAAL
jgi:hypothetical protein